MSNLSQYTEVGYVCTVKGCDKAKSHRYTLMGLCMHIRDYHGEDELQKRLRTRVEYK